VEGGEEGGVGLSSFFLLLPFYFLLRLGSQPEIRKFSLS